MTVLVIGLCLGIGGILKGATGVGAPLVAVPALAALFDVQFAVAVMLVPNLVTNLWQAWRFRAHMPTDGFARVFALSGAAGVVLGTVMLAYLPQQFLSLLVAISVFGYVLFRIGRAEWTLPPPLAARLNVPLGLLAGVLQGASGISAPISLSFLNAVGLERPVFIVTVSVFFSTMTAAQIPFAAWFGILTPERLLVSAAAILPIVLMMPVGALLARRFSKRGFDRLVLGLLLALSIRLLFGAFH